MTGEMGAYYAETDPAVRLRILRQTVPDAQRRELLEAIWQRRYADRPKQPPGCDYFLRSYLVANSYTNPLGRRLRGGVEKTTAQLRYDLFLEEAPAYPGGMEALRLEFGHCARLYFDLCRTDRAYGSRFWGAVPMKKHRLEEKLSNEITLFAAAVRDTFADEGLTLFAETILESL